MGFVCSVLIVLLVEFYELEIEDDALPMVVLVSRIPLSGVIYPARNSVTTYKPFAAAVSTKSPFFLNKIYIFLICLILLRVHAKSTAKKKKIFWNGRVTVLRMGP